MKFLSIYSSIDTKVGHHDSNFTVYDNGRVTYHKFEREYTVKHVEVSEYHALERCEEITGISANEFDGIAFFDIDRRTNDEPYLHEIRYNGLTENQFFLDHHYSHYKSVAWVADQTPDIGIVLDGAGNKTSMSIFDGCGDLLERNKSLNSIGKCLEAVSSQMGIDASVPDLCGKGMALQSHSEVDQVFLDHLRTYSVFDNFIDHFLDLNSYLNNSEHGRYFASVHPMKRIATIHKRLEEMVFEIFDLFVKDANSVIYYAGGVAQNVLWNTELKKKYPNLVIPPHSGDEGQSLGGIAFLLERFGVTKLPRIENYPYAQNDFAPDSVPSDDTIEIVAQALADGKVVSWYQGHGEIGPRALGNRSLLMNPADPDGLVKMNYVKNRETWRPFGATCLIEHADSIFSEWVEDKYMLYTAKVKVDNLPAVTHIDKTCRCQMLGDENPHFRKLLEKFYEKTGIPILLNTSLNTAGKPICGRPNEVIQLPVDLRVVGDNYQFKT